MRGRGTRTKQQRQTKSYIRRRRRCEAEPQIESKAAQVCTGLSLRGGTTKQLPKQTFGPYAIPIRTPVAKAKTYLARFLWLHKPPRSRFCLDSTDCFGATRLCIHSNPCAPRNDCTPGHAFSSEPLRRPSLRGRGTRTKQQRQTKNCNRRRLRCEAEPQIEIEEIVAQACTGSAVANLWNLRKPA